LARFLSQQLIVQAPSDKTEVAAAGFSNDERVESSDPSVDKQHLEEKHEEEDTRIILHCVESIAPRLVVAVRDIDVLILLLTHFHQMTCSKLWLKAGTLRLKLGSCKNDADAKKPKYFVVHSGSLQVPNHRYDTRTNG